MNAEQSAEEYYAEQAANDFYSLAPEYRTKENLIDMIVWATLKTIQA